MSKKAILFISFEIKKGVSVEDFMAAAEKVHTEIMSKQKGFISWNQLTVEDTWADMITFETMGDAENALHAGGENPVAHAFFDLLDMPSVTTRIYTVEKSH